MVRLSCNPHVLRRLALFSPLSDAQFGALLPQLERRSYAAKSRIVRAGEGADGLYVIVSGRAKLTFLDGGGRELVAASMGPEDFFGETGVIDGNPRAANIDAQDACEILFVPRHVLLECVEHCARSSAGSTMRIARWRCSRSRAAKRRSPARRSASVTERSQPLAVALDHGFPAFVVGRYVDPIRRRARAIARAVRGRLGALSAAVSGGARAFGRAFRLGLRFLRGAFGLLLGDLGVALHFRINANLFRSSDLGRRRVGARHSEYGRDGTSYEFFHVVLPLGKMSTGPEQAAHPVHCRH
jgi:CRP-like cAMP-binding protein